MLQRMPTGKSDDDAKRREVSVPHTTGRERDRQTDYRQTDRDRIEIDRDTETDGQTDRKRQERG